MDTTAASTTRFPPQNRGFPCYYDANRVAHCARPGEHIVFMGDSLTRYQWLALAYSFHRGTELSSTEFPSMVKEREWRHWMPFYNGSTERLKPNGRCDCHRSFAKPVGSKTVENRYYWLESSKRNGERIPLLNLSFVQVLTPETIFGHWQPTGENANEAHRAAVNPVFAPRWRMNWQQVMREVVAKLQPKPTVLVLNMGLWSGPPNASYAKELEAVARSVAPRVVWKTTTRMRKAGPSKWLRTDLLPRRVFSEVFDAARLTRGLVDRDYWDPRHFHPHVYNHLNAALLRQLYGPPTQCDDFNHGRCAKGVAPTATSAPLEPERAEAVAAAQPAEGWAGVASRPPSQWNSLQTMLWLDSLGIEYDAKALANRGVNGTTLLDLDVARKGPMTALDELGINNGHWRRVILPQLNARLTAGAQVSVASSGGRVRLSESRVGGGR